MRGRDEAGGQVKQHNPQALHRYLNAARPILSILYVLGHSKISLEKSAINSQAKNTIRTVN